MFRTVTGILAMVASLGAATLRVDASIPPSQALQFAILRGDSAIGQHTVAFREEGADLHVDIAIDIEVRLFFMTAFRYEHRSHEIWRDGRLIALDTRTDDDGTNWAVRGRATPDGFEIASNSGSFVAPAGILPTSYWQPRTTARATLLDTQRGRLVSVAFEPAGREQIATSEGTVEAERYRMHGDLDATLWYTPAGEWVKLAFEAKGDTVEYLPNRTGTALARSVN